MGSGTALIDYDLRTLRKSRLMEMLIKFLDSCEDFVIATNWRLRRFLNPRPKERRQVLRTSLPPRETTKPGDDESPNPAF